MKRIKRALASVLVLLLCVTMLPEFALASPKDVSMTKESRTEQPYYPAQQDPAFVFRSSSPFTLRTANNWANWDRVLEYSTDAVHWYRWEGETISSGPFHSQQRLLLRGTGNYVICSSPSQRWVLSGTDISVSGSIEYLLDYRTVKAGNHPVMGDYAFAYMFLNNASLISAPRLSATRLAPYCYYEMFNSCTSLTKAPQLPAAELAEHCYTGMFATCTSLVEAPALPAMTLAAHCYSDMFYGCSSLANPPDLPALTLTDHCYFGMFYDCCSLVKAPDLPAEELADSCYSEMFDNCTSLKVAPSLPAENLARYCYAGMFAGCSALGDTPALPATELANYCYASMFAYCTSLTVPPALPALRLGDACYSWMFEGCSSLRSIPALYADDLPYACYMYMFKDCSSLKLSETAANQYSTPYRVPISGYASNVEHNALGGMFAGTGGTFTDTPQANTTYYLHESNGIVW